MVVMCRRGWGGWCRCWGGEVGRGPGPRICSAWAFPATLTKHGHRADSTPRVLPYIHSKKKKKKGTPFALPALSAGPQVASVRPQWLLGGKLSYLPRSVPRVEFRRIVCPAPMRRRMTSRENCRVLHRSVPRSTPRTSRGRSLRPCRHYLIDDRHDEGMPGAIPVVDELRHPLACGAASTEYTRSLARIRLGI